MADQNPGSESGIRIRDQNPGSESVGGYHCEDIAGGWKTDGDRCYVDVTARRLSGGPDGKRSFDFGNPRFHLFPR
jgi:hypothetical protein